MRPPGYLLPKPEVDPMAIVREVARGFGLTHHDILHFGRSPRVCVARACAMAVVRKATNLSYPAIGEVFDRDHTTVMYNVAKVEKDPELSQAVDLVLDEMDLPSQHRLFAVPDEEHEAL